MEPGSMEVPSWANTETIAVCRYVHVFGCPPDWGIIGAYVGKSAALCALRWHVLYLAHQPGKLVTGSKVWKDWELGVLLRGWAALYSTDTARDSIYKVLAQWLPGRTAYAVKQAVLKYLEKHKSSTEARLAGWPGTLLGMLEAWTGPKSELSAIQHTLLPAHVVAAEILAELVPGNPAWPNDGAQDLSASGSATAEESTMTDPYTYPQAPLSAPTAPKGISSINAEVYGSQFYCIGSPIRETSSGALLTYPASRSGSSSSSAAPHASFLGYEAMEAVMHQTMGCNSSGGSPVSACGSALWDGNLPPYSVFGSAGGSGSSVFSFGSFSNSGSTSPPSAFHTSHPGQGFSLPDDGAALDACGVELGPTAAYHQPAAAFGVDILNTNSHNSCTAGSMAWHGYSLPVAGVDVGSMEIHLGTLSAQVHPIAPSNKFNLAAPSSKYTQPRAAAAAVKSGNKAAKRCSKSTKQTRSKPQQRQVALSTAPSRKRKASGDAVGLPQTDTTAAFTATTAAGQPRPTKRHHGRATQEQQQQYLPMEFAGQYCLNQEQYVQLQGMQWAVTAAEYSDPFQVSTAAMDPEAFLCESLYSLTPTVAAAGDDTTQPPDWYMAGISLEGHGSDVDPVQQVLDSPQLSKCSTNTPLVTPDWSQLAMELDSAEEAFGTALQHNVPLDMPMQTPWQLVSHQAALAAPAPPAAAAASDGAIFMQGQQPWKQQQQGASGASVAGLSAQVAGCDILKWLGDADLADAMQEDLEGHQAMAKAPPAAGDAADFVRGKQAWQQQQQQQQGAAHTSAADLAAQLAADSILGWLNATDLAAVTHEDCWTS